MDLEQLFASFDGAFADNTLRAYRSDFAQFQAWCDTRQLNAWAIEPQHMADFVDAAALSKSPASVRRMVASIGSLYRLAGLDAVNKAPAVMLALKRMHRRLGRAQRQAVPLTRAVLDALIATCGEDRLGLADKVLLRLGYETMRRRSELCQFQFSDLEHLSSGKVALRLRFSKTDQMGAGKLIPISTTLDSLLDQWAREVGAAGFILRSRARPTDPQTPMVPASINLRLRALQSKAQLELGGWLSGHSFRVGAALDLLESGVGLEKIMLRGGWNAESTVIKYLRAWQFDD